ncbi:Receptor-type tyrosine-protein phosphatase beta [Echinococcus granulosus]|nr:Receptor-type tyrosine-protein phosphatase beta [Echinococcus granulosus]
MNACFWGIICLYLTSLVGICLCQIEDSTQLPEIIKDNPTTTTPIPVPQNLVLKTRTHNSIEATWNLLPNASTPHQYTYTVCAKPEKSTEGLMVCCYTSKTNSCTVTHLIANTAYNVTIDACFTQNPKLCSLKSEPLVVYTKPDPLLKILLGIFIPLIIIILLVLLFVFRKRIPFIRNLFEKESTMGDGESTPFPIEYYTPPGPGTLSNMQPPIPVKNFAANLRELNANNGFEDLFRNMAYLETSEIVEKYRLTKVAATQGGNRNRYSDMPPYDQSLVLVGRPWSTVINDPQPQITASEVEKGYINASYVRRPEYGSGGEALVSSFSTRPAYIATQGPLRSTVTDFLTMVCQQRCPLIIMLCQCIEDGKIKCTQYWPDGMTSTFESEKCTVEVRKESEENFGSVIRRELKIHPSSEASPWTVTQFHFTGWVDNDAPNVESFYNLVVMQNDFLATHPMGVECGPTVVHCSAGVGRTGTFMAARFLLDRLRTNPQNVDIVGTVLAMRKWRANLVQVWSQLQFLYNFIDFCLRKENLGVKPIAPGPKALPAAPSAEYKNVVEDPQHPSFPQLLNMRIMEEVAS